MEVASCELRVASKCNPPPWPPARVLYRNSQLLTFNSDQLATFIPMADEIDQQNVIRVWRAADGRWQARIGPDDERAIDAVDDSPTMAVAVLMSSLAIGGYAFDPSWAPQG